MILYKFVDEDVIIYILKSLLIAAIIYHPNISIKGYGIG